MIKQPSNYVFACFTGEIAEDFVGEGKTLIIFAPLEYWKQHECLPDYGFGEEMETFLPVGYQWVVFCEETAWATDKSELEVRQELSVLGFIESKEMEQFLTDCMS